MILPVALVLMGVAHLLDYATFFVMIGHHGLEAELNPLVVLLFERMGPLGVTLAKAGGILFAASVVTIIVRTHRVLAGVVLGFGIVSGLIGAYSNLITL
ncbi:MAG: hypothetical protein M3253_04670 [Chloroflexota bacterium]|nr:hypothetical protein [Chloroflexota bacterium]